jgi:hypothetical protein
MKSCDICKKPTAFLEDLEYCSVCVDCLGEIEEQDNDNFFESFPEINDEQPKD